MPAPVYSEYKNPETGEVILLPQLFPLANSTGEGIPPLGYIFNISENMLVCKHVIKEAHFLLKTECVKARLSIKDFAYAMILKGLKEIKEEKFKKRLKESIQQSKEGNGRVISAAELDELVKNAE